MNIKNLSRWLVDFVVAYPGEHKVDAIWRKPLIACATADERFERLKDMVAPDHGLPRDLLPEAKAVVV